MKNPVWFILGLSGAGKSYLGQFVGTRNLWCHFEIDQWRPGVTDGLDVYGFRDGWNEFEARGSPSLLIRQVLQRCAGEGKRGAVLTFGSTRILSAEQMAVLDETGTVFYLGGNRRFCLRAFLEREQETGRNLSEDHWQEHNAALLEALSAPAMSRWIIDAFTGGGGRRAAEELMGLAGG